MKERDVKSACFKGFKTSRRHMMRSFLAFSRNFGSECQNTALIWVIQRDVGSVSVRSKWVVLEAQEGSVLK